MIIDSDELSGKGKGAIKGGYDKFQASEKELSTEDLAKADEIDNVMTVKEFTGDSKGTVPKKIEIQGGEALSKEVEKEPEKKESGFKTFVKGVGEAFQNIAEGAEKKLETVY